MLRIAIRSLISHKLRSLLISGAIVMGISFVAGTLILTDSIRAGFNELFEASYSQTDFIIETTADSQNNQAADCPTGSDNTNDCFLSADGQPVVLDDQLVDQLSQLAGVKTVEPSIQASVLALTADNQPLWSNPFGGFGFGFSWPEQIDNSALSLADDGLSRPPQAASEVVIDLTTADKHGLKVGDTIKLEATHFQRPAEAMTIVGFASYGRGAGLTSFVSLQLAEAKRFFDLTAGYTDLNLQADEHTDLADLAVRLDQALPGGFRVSSVSDRADEQIADIGQGLDFVASFLLVFAGISIFVGIFVVQNTFKIILSQRTRELGLLRLIGASRRQLRQLVLYEAIFIGLIGSVLGLVVGAGLATLSQLALKASSLPVPDGGLVISSTTVLVSLIVGVLVALVSAVLPARRAGRTSPLQAISDFGADQTAKATLVRSMLGGLVTGLGVASLAYGLTGASGQSAVSSTGLGAGLIFIGVAVLSPVFIKQLAYLIVAPLKLLKSVTVRLAYDNICRQPRQAAASASTIMIGVALVVLVTVLASTFKQVVIEQTEVVYPADLTVSSRGFGPQASTDDKLTEGIVPIQVASELKQQPQLQDVTAVSYSYRAAKLAAQQQAISLAGVDPSAFAQVISLGLSDQALANLAAGQIVVKDTVAESHDWQPGDSIVLDYGAKTQVEVYQLGGVFDQAFDTDYIVSHERYREHIDDQVVTYIAINAAAGVDLAAAKQAVATTIGDYSALVVLDKAELQAQAITFIDTSLSVLQGLLGLSLLVAISGIINNLILAISERTREIGLLRAVGLSQRQLRQMIRLESIIIAFYGAFLGSLLGLGFGWAILKSLAGLGLVGFSIPWLTIIIYLALAILVGVLAALWPASRASRLDIIKAIAHQ